MSLAKVSSGDGYEYYLRSIATNDLADRGQQALADYYSERGETPGRWTGSGLGNVGLAPGDPVAEPQMRALFGRGLHPDAEAIMARVSTEARAEGLGPRSVRSMAWAAAQIGRPFTAREDLEREQSYRARCAVAMEEWNLERGHISYAPIPEEERARIRTEVAIRMFTKHHGQPPANDRELSGWIARASRTGKPVAGFDFTFSPVKSVSALWALGSPEVAAAVEAAHQAAIDDALAYLEAEACYTRKGARSVQQVEVAGGLIGTQFTHRDSRAGDPDLHTHLVVANKVLRHDGKWGAIDARMFYRHNVPASEVYNTRLEQHLETALGVVFADRPGLGGKRAVREIVGIDPRLLQAWSTRAAAVEGELAVLARRFQADHGREPTRVELLRLGQQAVLATRPDKPAARTAAEQREVWAGEAAGVLGGRAAVQQMLDTALNQAGPEREVPGPEWVAATARLVVDTVAETRATWQFHHVSAETARRLRGTVAPDRWRELFAAVTTAALAPPRSLPRGEHEIAATTPALARADGTSVYTTAKSTLYTSPEILAAEARLVDTAREHDGTTIPVTAATAAIDGYAAANPGRALNLGQQLLVRTFATSGARLQVALAPAGTGKTTAMQVFAEAWTRSGGTVLGLAPTASAAAVLQRETSVPSFTVDLLNSRATALDQGTMRDPPEWLTMIGPGTMVILDEAAKTPTRALDQAVAWLVGRGASVRSVGDDQQLSSVAAGGVIRDIVHATGATGLSEVMRFTDPGERAASLALREGDPAALGFYFDHDRIHVGVQGAIVEDAFTAWAADTDAEVDAALLAPTRELVTALNDRARTHRLARDGRHGREVRLSDGLHASAGDTVTTRLNDYGKPISKTDYVRNGYRWTVREVHRDGRITVAHIGSGRRATLDAGYVAEHVTLGYATTIDSAQGMTVQACHSVLTGRETRAQLYVAMTRGRAANHAFLATAGTGAESDAYTYDALNPPAPLDVLTAVLAREGTQTSATTAIRLDRDPRTHLAHAAAAYRDALGVVAADMVGPELLAAVDDAAERLAPGITGEDAYPVLRAHLATLAAGGADPVAVLTDAATARELGSAVDRAAVIDWRIDPTGRHSYTGTGSLGWLPGIPDALADDPVHGAALVAHRDRVATLRDQITAKTAGWSAATAPMWARPLVAEPTLLGELAIWRAAHDIPDNDRRPTGPTVYPVAERRVQQHLDRAVHARLGDLGAEVRRWKTAAAELDPALTTDPYWPVLAEQWTRAAAAGHDPAATARTALAADGPLPVESPAAALRWRMSEILDAPAEPDHHADLVAAMRADRWRRHSDRQLDDRIRKMRSSVAVDPSIAVADSFARREAADRLARIQAHHAELDRQAAAITRARDDADAHTAAEQALAETKTALYEARTLLDETGKLRWQRRGELTDTINTLKTTMAAQQQVLDDVAARARDSADEVGAPEMTWPRILDQAADHHGRRTAVVEARAHDQNIRERLDNAERRRDRDAEQLQQGLAELRRRRTLTDAERGAEHAARAELGVRNEPAPAAEPRRAAPEFDSGFEPPVSGPQAGRDGGYGL